MLEKVTLKYHGTKPIYKLTMTNIEFDKMLDLSTGHMPNTSPDWGDYRVRAFEYGFVVWISKPNGAHWDETCPEWLMPIMKAAYDEGAKLLLFDADAEIHPHWATYEW